MKVFIVSDLEGVSGIVKAGQISGGRPLYDEARRLYTEEINAAARGARSGGATEIVVMDCHGGGEEWAFNSLVPELLDEDVDYVVQNAWTEYTEFLEEGVDAALFVGMHARAGTRDGVLNHTVSGQVWQNLWFNGTLVGESGINAALCGAWQCPVALVTGDSAACREAHELLGPDIVTVAVKQGIGRESARNIAPRRARRLIEEGAQRAMGAIPALSPYDPGSPCEIRVEYKTTAAPDEVACRYGVERIDDRTIVSEAGTWLEAWRQFFS